MRIHWDQAVDSLAGMVPARRPVAVCIAGPTGSGKSTLARALAQHIGDSLVIGTDSYLPDYAELEPHQYDLPEHSALAELASHIDQLLAGHPTTIPVWCFKEHRRTGSQLVQPAGLIIVEGIHALQSIVAERAALRALVEASADDRLARAIARELSGARGWEIEPMTDFIQTIADPTFATFLPEYRAVAHAIIDNPGRP